MNPMKLLLLLAALGFCLAAIVPGHIHADEETLQPNAFCPVMPDEPIDPSIHVEYEGRRVYLCCNMCRRAFLAEPEKYLGNLPEGYFAEVLSDPAEEPAQVEPREEIPTRHDVHHDHELDHMHPETTLERLVVVSGRFHPLAVHFPIALVFAALLAEALGLWFRPARMFDVSRFCTILAALSGILAGLLGWAAAAGAHYPTLEGTLEWHRWLGTASAVILVGAAVIGEIAARKKAGNWRWLFRGLLLLAAMLTGFAGYLGGVLVFGPGHFTFG